MDRSDPQRLGKYRVLEPVARGPLADVWRARLDGIAGFSRPFAIKRVHEAVAADPGRLARVEAEARRAAGLLHGNIVQVLDLGRDEAGRPYLVLEWVDGWSLAGVLARAREVGTPLPVPHAAWIGLAVLNALEVAHGHREGWDGVEVEAPFFHGALGPDDVLLSRLGEVKVSDFGLAHLATVLAAEAPDLLPGVRASRTPDVQGDLVDVARLLHAALTLEDAPSPLTGRAGVPAPLAAAVDALLAGADTAPRSASALKVAVTDALHGHVFTQETLSAWLRALYGLDEPAPAEPHADDGSQADLLSEEIGLDLDLADLPDVPSKDDWTAPEGDEGGGRTMLDDDDVRTQAQGAVPPPRGGTSPVAGRTGAATGSARTGAFRPAAGPDPWEAPSPAVVEPDLAARLAELRRGASAVPAWSEPGADAVDAPRRPWVGGLLAAVVLLALGAGVGAVVAGAIGRSSGLTVAVPVLDVRLPAGAVATIAVDGAPVAGPTRLAAGTHEVRVEVQGAAPWTFELPLADGEYRVIVLDAPQAAGATPSQPQ